MAISSKPSPKFVEYAPFDRDGRLKVSAGITHWSVMPCTHPMAITEASARRLLDELWRMGFTNHSGMGSMLWVPIIWCVHNNRAFEVWKWESGGIGSYLIHLDKLNPSISKEGARLIATLESVQEKKNNG